MADFSIPESSRYGAALDFGPAASYHHHRGRYQIQLSGSGFEASHYLSEEDLRDLRDWINEALGDGDRADCAETLSDFLTDHRNGLGPDPERLAPVLAALGGDR